MKTFGKKDAIHALNIFSIVMAWGVSSYVTSADTLNGTAAFFSSILLIPLNLGDQFYLVLTGLHLPDNFNVVFLTLWLSYFLVLRHLHPILMVRNHGPEELRRWYLSRDVRN